MRIGQLLEYKEYTGSIEYDPEEKLYYGELLNIEDFVSYHGKDCVDLYKKYQAAVDNYIKFKNSIDFKGNSIVLG